MTDSIQQCRHDLAEKETACADGYCPICLKTELVTRTEYYENKLENYTLAAKEQQAELDMYKTGFVVNALRTNLNEAEKYRELYDTVKENYSTVRKMLTEAKAELDKHRWVPVSEGLPKENCDVDVWLTGVKGGTTPRETDVHYSFVDKVFYIDYDMIDITEQVTHYRYITPPEK